MSLVVDTSALVAILLGTSLPILPTQILWINMTTAVALGLMLAWEPKEPGIMERPPRDPRRSLLTGPVVFRTLLASPLRVNTEAEPWPLLRAPFRGEHTDQVLRDLCGYDQARIDELRAAGTLG